MESILIGNITNWHELWTAQGKKTPQRVIKTAQNITDIHAVWQEIQKYPLNYHQIEEQLLPSGGETG